MSLLDQAAAKTDAADLMILANIETIRDQQQPATANAVAALIGGARVAVVQDRISKLTRIGLLEYLSLASPYYQLTEMGVELLRREIIGWSPSNREEMRRAAQLRQATNGYYG